MDSDDTAQTSTTRDACSVKQTESRLCTFSCQVAIDADKLHVELNTQISRAGLVIAIDYWLLISGAAQ